MNGRPAIDSLWDYRDPEGTERAFLELLGDGNPPAYRAEILTQVARARCLQRRFADADATLDEALADPEAVTDRVRVRALLERGRIQNDLSESAAALSLFHEALDLARAAGEAALAFDAAHMLGYVSEPAEAIRWNLEALAMAKASDDPGVRRWIPTLTRNAAAKLLEAGRWGEARETFLEAARVRAEAGQARGARDCRAGAAAALRLSGSPGDALRIVTELLDEPDVDPEWNGYIEEEAAECLLALGREDEAREHFARAYATLSEDPWFPPTDGERLERIRRMGGADRR